MINSIGCPKAYTDVFTLGNPKETVSIGVCMCKFSAKSFQYTDLGFLHKIDVEDAIELVVKQAECIDSMCSKGGMIAVLHNFELYNSQPLLYKNSELISINYKSHFVISADMDAVPVIVDFLKSRDIIYQTLPVSYAFHSRCIDEAELIYKTVLRTKNIVRPSIKCISCVTGCIISEINQDYLWETIRSPILFMNALKIAAEGRKCIFVDLGPSGTLANFAKNNLSVDLGHEIYSIITPFSQDKINYNKVLERFKEGGIL